MTTAPQTLLLENHQDSLQNLDCQSIKDQNKANRKLWSKEEDNQLQAAIYQFGTRWLQVATELPNRNPSQCAQRWKRLKPQSDKRGTYWSPEEDARVLQLMEIYPKKWGKIASLMINRTSKQVRERFINKLNPNINRNTFTEEEDQIIYESYKVLGSKWTKIAKLLRCRPENMVKNRFYSHIRRHYMHEENPYYIVPEKECKQNEHNLFKKMTKQSKMMLKDKLEQEEVQEKIHIIKGDNKSEPSPTSQAVQENNQEEIHPIIQPLLFTQPPNHIQPYLYQPPIYFAFQIPTIYYVPFEIKNEQYNRLTNSQLTMTDI